MKNGKEQITIVVDAKLKKLCKKYGLTVEQLLLQFQKDAVNGRTLENYYQQTLAELYLTEIVADKAKVDRSSVESVLVFMRSQEIQNITSHQLPEGLSRTTKRILKECDYCKNHSKN